MWIRYKNNEMIRTIGKWVYTPQYHSILGILPYQCGGKANIITDAVQEREGKKNYRDWGRSIEILYEQCASLKQLVRVLLSVNLWYWSTGCYASQVSLSTWKIETNVFEISYLLCMLFRYIILFVTILCKDNKLIFYLKPTNQQ